jgi:DNA-directed RNA polymerase
MSNNGSQHLAALTRDETIAPYVNLTPSELPGDLYTFVADHVWGEVSEDLQKINHLRLIKLKGVITNNTDLQNQLQQAKPSTDYRREVSNKLYEFKKKNIDALKEASPVFWVAVKDVKERRKVVKRGIMTLPYGGSAYGLGTQVIDDAKKHGIQRLYTMDRSWGVYMGRLIFFTCQKYIHKSMKLLSLFEAAGKVAEKEERFLSWTVPYTNFPVVQHYTECNVKRVYVQYGPPKGERTSTGYYENTLQLQVCFKEDQRNSKRKQAQGCAPNAIHSLDAAHLIMTVDACSDKSVHVTTVHDSFGTLLADMDILFEEVRTQFVTLHSEKILETLIKELDKSEIEYGTLDINLVKQSEYAFA